MSYNILFVDDMMVTRRLMRSVLKNIADTNFFEAQDGHQAMEVLATENIHLIILDMLMPNMNGFQVLKEIKNNTLYQGIQVIVHSAVNDQDSIKLALALGASDYFCKPMSPQELSEVLPEKVKKALRLID